MPTVKPTASLQKRSDQALTAFHTFHAAQWGETRWFESLYPALARPTRYCALLNAYAGVAAAREVVTRDDEAVEVEELVLPGLSMGEGIDSRPSAVVYPSSTREAVFPAPRAVRVTHLHGDTEGEDQQQQQQVYSLQSHWNMDGASVLVAHLLGAQPGDKVLDLCAAPGGKSIVLSQALWPELHAENSTDFLHETPTDIDTATNTTTPTEIATTATATKKSTQKRKQTSLLHANEADRTRYTRLCANLSAYLPRAHPRCAVTTSNLDLSGKHAVLALPLGAGGYDKVLLDAPCSSERHVVQAHVRAGGSGASSSNNNKSNSSKNGTSSSIAIDSAKDEKTTDTRKPTGLAPEMLNWSPNTTKTLARTQTGLLLTALRAVRVDGRVVYATCSISRAENEGVVEKALEMLKQERKKRKTSEGGGREKEGWKVEVDRSWEADGGVKGLLDRWSEKTGLGRIVVPDHVGGEGWGPLYFCVLRKVSRKGREKGKDEDRGDRGGGARNGRESDHDDHGESDGDGDGVANANDGGGVGAWSAGSMQKRDRVERDVGYTGEELCDATTSFIRH